MEAFKGGPPDIPGSPRPAMADDLPAREVEGMLLSPGVVKGVIMEPGTPSLGKRGCTWLACGFCGDCGDGFCTASWRVIVCAKPELVNAISPPNAPTTIAIARGHPIVSFILNQQTAVST